MSGYTVTPNYNLRKPIVGADNDLWGNDWNLNADTLDTQLKTVSNLQVNYLPLVGGTVSPGPLTIATGGALVSEPRNAGISLGFSDATGNFSAYIQPDGTFRVATMNPTALAGTIGGTASLTLPQITGSTSLNVTNGGTLQPVDPRAPGYTFAITDATGNVAFGIDTNGAVKANLPAATSAPTFTTGNVLATSADPRMADTAYEITDANGQGGIAITTEGRLAFTPALGQIAAPAQTTIRRRTIMTTSPWNISSNAGTDTVPTTYHSALTMETCGFDAVRLIFAVDNAAGAPFGTIIQNCAVAVSAVPNDYLNPLDPTGAAAAWVPVTFNNAGAPKHWETQTFAPGTGTRTVTLIPAPTVSTVDGSAQDSLNGYTYSDWIPISSYNRTDAGGRWPILMTRCYATGPGGTGAPRSRVIPQIATQFGNNVGDRFWNMYSQPGDFVTSWAGYAPGAATGNTILVAIQYYSRARGLTIMAIGDSIVGGTGGTGGIAWGARSCFALSTPTFPVSYFLAPSGVGVGVSPAAWVTNAENVIDALQPQAVLGLTMSRNWTINRTNVDLLWQRFMQMGMRMERLGGMLVYVAPVPCPGTYTSTTEPLRKDIISRVAQCSSGAQLTFDPNIGMSQGLTPVDSYIPYYTADQIHPNDRGHDSFTAVIVKLVRGAVGA